MSRPFLLAAICIAFILDPASTVSAGWDGAMAASVRNGYAMAIRQLRPLAEQGQAGARYNPGFIYNTSHGTPQDHAEMLKWSREAADRGDASAQFNLGVMYLLGVGVPHDHAEAVKWFRKAADQGQVGAQYNLGLMYLLGQGVLQDFVQAHMWFDLAAANGGETARETRDNVAGVMTPAQIAEARKLAREWKPKK